MNSSSKGERERDETIRTKYITLYCRRRFFVSNEQRNEEMEKLYTFPRESIKLQMFSCLCLSREKKKKVSAIKINPLTFSLIFTKKKAAR